MVPGMEDFRDRSPITGRADPVAPPASLTPDPDAGIVTGEVTFGLAFEGAPGCVHGGFVAAVLDEALGMASVFSGGPGMTAELTARYRQHTPVSTSLRIEARLASVEGRKIRTTGELYDGDVVTAEGSGLFIAVDAAKFEKLLADRSERTSD
jgi:acyl-coenzyme A thioesterase PaaI-like protein